MDETWILPKARPGAVIEWLDEVAVEARLEQRRNPLRPQGKVLNAHEIDIRRLPLPVRGPATAAGAIYAHLPSPEEPFGRIWVLALMQPLEKGALRLELASDPRFALFSRELIWHLRRHVGPIRRVRSGRRVGLLTLINGLADNELAGAPVLACNLWLEEQLAHLPEGESAMHLFAPWLAHYRSLRGRNPADPARSFRAAVASSRDRMKRRARSD